MARTPVHTHIKKKHTVETPLEAAPIPAWQKKETVRRLKEMQKKSAASVSWTDGIKKIKQNFKLHS